MALDQIDPEANLPLHLSFDVDGMDPFVIPSTGTPVKAGLTLREAQFIVKALKHTNRLFSMDLTELNPKIGTKEDIEKTFSNASAVLEYYLDSRKI